MLRQKDIDLHTEELNEAIERRDTLKSEHDGKRTKIADLQAQIKENNAANEEFERTIRTLQNEQTHIANEYHPLIANIERIQRTLEEDAWQKQVAELVAEQADFYSVLERELTKMQADLKDDVGNFVTFVDPATACKNIRKVIEHGGIGNSQLTLRSGLNNYQQAITDLCEKKLRGQPIDISLGQLPVDRLKEWLRHQDVIIHWKR